MSKQASVPLVMSLGLAIAVIVILVRASEYGQGDVRDQLSNPDDRVQDGSSYDAPRGDEIVRSDENATVEPMNDESVDPRGTSEDLDGMDLPVDVLFRDVPVEELLMSSPFSAFVTHEQLGDTDFLEYVRARRLEVRESWKSIDSTLATEIHSLATMLAEGGRNDSSLELQRGDGYRSTVFAQGGKVEIVLSFSEFPVLRDYLDMKSSVLSGLVRDVHAYAKGM